MYAIRSYYVFSRVSYAYDNRYFLTGSMRNDASSKLYVDNNDGNFSAVSGAWKISSEPFFNVGAVNLLKLRASWGQIGNVNSVDNYSYVAGYEATRGTVLGQNKEVLSGLGLENVPNLGLSWETSEQTDFGFDMNLFNNKLSLVADYYIKYTKQFIDDLPNPATYGTPVASKGNIGEVKNEGFELAVSYGDTKGDFTYRVGVNMATNKNKVTDLGNSDIQWVDESVRQVLRPIYNGA